jgi:tetratricopeptide (TPR) repeat protein
MGSSSGKAAGVEAQAVLRRSLALWEQLHREHPDNAFFERNIASGHNNLAEALIHAGEFDAAEPDLRIALDISTALAAKDPADGELKAYQAVAQTHLARVWAWRRKNREARQALLAAIERFDALPEAVASDVTLSPYRALASYTLGQVSDDRHEACRAFGRALEVLQPLAQHPGIAPGALQLDTVRAALRRCG